MRRSHFLSVVVALSLALVPAAHGQDNEPPSLGDLARQSRQAKQQRDKLGNTSAARSPSNGNTATVPNSTPSQSSFVEGPQNPSADTQKKPLSPVIAAVKNSQPSGPPKRVITNEDMAATNIAGDASSASKAKAADPARPEPTDGKNPPEYWSSQILAQKNAVANLKSDIDRLGTSIQYAPANCVEGCVEWNQHQQQKQQQVDSMKAQLEGMQKQLEEIQEAARKQGYGSSVYDP